MPGLTLPGNPSLLKYNDYVFPPALKMTANVTPVQSASGRGSKYNHYSITVEFIVSATGVGLDTSIDNLVSDLRKRLTKQGSSLLIEAKGLGRIDTLSQDLAFGPTPTNFRWEPIYGSFSALCSWTVEFNIADSCLGISPLTKLVDFAYAYTHEIDSQGYTRITHSGMWEMGNNRMNPVSGATATGVSLFPVADPDFIRESLKINLLPGFKRVSQQYDMAPDSRTVTFTIIDEEIRSRYSLPPQVADIDVQHRISNDSIVAGVKWNVELSGTIKGYAGQNKSFLYNAMLSIIREKRRAIKNGKAIIQPDPSHPYKSVEAPGGFILTRDFEVTDNVFGDSISFRVSWIMFTSLDTMVKASGLFAHPWQENGQPKDHTAWSDIHRQRTNERGMSKIKANGVYPIVGACEGINSYIDQSKSEVNIGDEDSLLFPEDQESEGQYIAFQPETELDTDTGNAVHYPLGGGYQYNTSPPNYGLSDGIQNNVGTSHKKPIVQRRTTPQHRVKIKGKAVRVNATIPVPEISSFQGHPVTPIGKPFFRQTALLQTVGKKVLYAAAWEREYIVHSPPYGVPALSDTVPLI